MRTGTVCVPGPQAAHLGADRDQGVLAGGGVGEAHSGVPGLESHLVRLRSPAPAVRSAPRRCAPSGRRPSGELGWSGWPIGRSPGWPHSRSPRERSGRFTGGELVGAELEESRVQLGDERDVEAVEPGHRLVGDVLVLVEGPARRQQQVTAAHRHRVPVDVGPHTLAVDDEPEGSLAVAVRGGDLARAQVLDRGPQGRQWRKDGPAGRGWTGPWRGARRHAPPVRARPERCAMGSSSAHRHRCGTAAGCGDIGMRSSTCVHSGIRPASSKSAYSSSSSLRSVCSLVVSVTETSTSCVWRPPEEARFLPRCC